MIPEAAETAESAVSLGTLLEGFANTQGLGAIRITGMELDSRRVSQGSLFVALKGHQVHGLKFAPVACEKGCAAVLFDPQDAGGWRFAERDSNVPWIEVPDLASRLGCIADRYFDQPSRMMKVVAITGTNGKTSCSHFLAEALGAGAGVLGTLGWGAPGALTETQNTTSDAVATQRFLAALLKKGFGTVVMEASSHGLHQGRMNGVTLAGVVLTNFSRDHLDYHGTMEAYLEAKLRLLSWENLDFIAFNAESPFREPVIGTPRPGCRRIGFASKGFEMDGLDALVTYGDVEFLTEGLRFTLTQGAASHRVTLPLFGEFNVENVAATVAALMGMGDAFEVAVARLDRLRPVPGRMEQVARGGRHAVIDYAHTPDALASVLGSVRKHCEGALWVVFGCGGDRDAGKRALMGRAVEQFADHVVITDDNPRSECGEKIIEDIRAGLVAKEPLVIRNRREAIATAIRALRPRDLAVIAGKGHETYQEVAGIRHPFSDREVARDIMDQLHPFVLQ